MSSATATPRVTTAQFRKSVTGWLEEENATIEQALMLQSTLEAGAIAGDNYEGNRRTDDEAGDGLYTVVDKFLDGLDEEISTVENAYDVENEVQECGCLVETFERIKRGRRPVSQMGGQTTKAFWFALLLGIGDTPQNNKWARAAARGIEDYIAALEVAA